MIATFLFYLFLRTELLIILLAIYTIWLTLYKLTNDLWITMNLYMFVHPWKPRGSLSGQNKVNESYQEGQKKHPGNFSLQVISKQLPLLWFPPGLLCLCLLYFVPTVSLGLLGWCMCSCCPEKFLVSHVLL